MMQIRVEDDNIDSFGNNICTRITMFNSEEYMNPFLSKYDTEHGVPPFDRIRFEHFRPAFAFGFAQQVQEYEMIEENEESPTFENTIEAIEKSGSILSRVSRVFYSLLATDSSPEMTVLAKELSSAMASHRSRFSLSEKIFRRVQFLVQHPSTDWTMEQSRLLKEIHSSYSRSGVLLAEPVRNRLAEIDSDIAELSADFRSNLLIESNDATVFFSSPLEVEGVSVELRHIARTEAQKEQLDGWLFTANRITLYPFLTTAVHRDSRRKLYEAYVNRARNDNQYDNRILAQKIATLRSEKASLLGFNSYAEYALENSMAKTPERVLSFLDQIWDAAKSTALRDSAVLQEYLHRDGLSGELEPWDWWFYVEKRRMDQFDLKEEVIREYLPLDKVLKGAFSVANRLFQIDFIERKDIPVYHPDVRVFEVKTEEDASTIGMLYLDYFARPSKRGGAWMSSFQVQHCLGGEHLPIVINVCNFPMPHDDRPSLLSSIQVKTLFHEFGHALHGLLSSVHYPSLSGTAVLRDYVEFPSQLMENWGRAPDIMREYAEHYQDESPLPRSLIDTLEKMGNFNQGFSTTEYLAAAYLDLAWHMQPKGLSKTADEIEEDLRERIGMLPQIDFRYRSSYFSHIFAGGYASFYYCYIWAAVLEKDAYALFEEKGLFHRETAQNLLKHVYSVGNSKDSLQEYQRFRGAEPSVEALLQKRGLLSYNDSM